MRFWESIQTKVYNKMIWYKKYFSVCKIGIKALSVNIVTWKIR